MAPNRQEKFGQQEAALVFQKKAMAPGLEILRDVQKQQAVTDQRLEEERTRNATASTRAEVQTRQRLNNTTPTAKKPMKAPEEVSGVQKGETAQTSHKKRREKSAEKVRQESQERIQAQQQRAMTQRQRSEDFQRNSSYSMTDRTRSRRELLVETSKRLDSLSIPPQEKDFLRKEYDSLILAMKGIEGYFLRTIPDKFDVFDTFLKTIVGVLALSNNHATLLRNKLNQLGAEGKMPAEEARHQSEVVRSVGYALDGARIRLPDVGYEAFANQEKVNWQELLIRAHWDQEIDAVDQKIGHMGAAMSSVTTIGEGKQTKFFKEDEHIQSQQEILDNAMKEVKASLQTDQERQIIDRFCESKDGAPSMMERVIQEMKTVKPGEKEPDLNNLDIEKLMRQRRSLQKLGATYISEQLATQVIKEVLRRRLTSKIATNISIQEGQKLTPRNVATTRMAELLGMKDVVVRSQRVKLVQKDKERMGFVMDKARGENFTHLLRHVSSGKDVYTGQFQRQLLNLQLMDNLCGQVDRHLNNIFYEYTQRFGVNRFQSLQGIDNDMCFGLRSLMQYSFGAFRGCLDDNGVYTLPVVDRSFYEHLLSISEFVIAANFSGLMEPAYWGALASRVEALQTGIQAALRAKTCRIVDEDEWGDDTLKELCEGQSARDNKNYVSKFYFSRRQTH